MTAREQFELAIAMVGLTGALAVLKAAGLNDWPWIGVCAPLWVPLLFGLGERVIYGLGRVVDRGRERGKDNEA